LPPDTESVVDLGSGGGSPAIPLKLAVPAINLCMVESKTRKSAFLREAVRHLGLEGVTVETARFEELLSESRFLQRFDVLTMRAVRCDAGTLAQVAPLSRAGGHLLFFTTETEVPRLFDTGGWHLSASEPLLPALRTRLAIFRRVSSV
jgi:16S rRNA (guanine527-N7)-methyltransferase